MTGKQRKNASESKILSLEAKVKELHHKLLQAEQVAALATVTPSVIHGINNPLEGIKNYLYLLNLPGQEKRRDEFLEIIESELSRISQIVRNLVQLHSLIAQEKSPVNIDSLLLECRQLFTFHFEHKKLVPQLLLNTPDSFILGSSYQLKQVFLCLFENVIEYAQNKVGVRTSSSADLLAVTIEDDRPEAGAIRAQQICASFSSAQPELDRQFISLYVAHNLVKDHDGTMTLEITSKNEFRIILTLPQLRK